jgi:hypothetical protein
MAKMIRHCPWSDPGAVYFFSPLAHILGEKKEYRMETDRLRDDDQLYEKARVATLKIQAILAEFPLQWQAAILTALGARTVVLREKQQDKPPDEPLS